MKVFIKNYKFKGSKELYKINLDKLKKVIFGCAEIENDLDDLKDKKDKDYDSYIVYDESKSVNYWL
jgi:hypothetical protein